MHRFLNQSLRSLGLLCLLAGCGQEIDSVVEDPLPIPDRGCLEVEPEAPDFGPVKGGCRSGPQSFRIRNACPTESFLTALSVSGDFILMQSPAIPAGGLRLEPGQEPLPLQVKFEPIQEGVVQGALTFEERTGSETRTHQLVLSGTGTSPAWKTDVIAVDPLPNEDFLFVIDRSPSMAAHQQNVASNLAAFLRYALSTSVDFHVAVMSADPMDGAALLSGPTHPETVLDRTTPDLEAKFAEKVAVGMGASGGPSCLEQALAALTSPLVAPENAGFLRDDAHLKVICVTASADQSPLAASDYMSGFWDIKGTNRKTLFEFHAIGGFSESCVGDAGALADAVRQSNGVKDDICNSDWHRTLENWGYVYALLGHRYGLSAVPDLARGPLEVAIDGQSLAQVDSRGQLAWSLSTTEAAITFEPMYAPQPGSTLAISYPVACSP